MENMLFMGGKYMVYERETCRTLMTMKEPTRLYIKSTF